MTRKIIEWLIKIINRISAELKRALIETYGDYDLTREFENKVSEIKFKNKNKYKNQIMQNIQQAVLKEEGYLIPPWQAEMIAEQFYHQAKNNGLLGILNEITGEKKNGNN